MKRSKVLPGTMPVYSSLINLGNGLGAASFEINYIWYANELKMYYSYV